MFLSESLHRGEGGPPPQPVDNPPPSRGKRKSSLLELLLRPQLVGVAALLLAAVFGAGGEARVADAADLLVLVELSCEDDERRLDDTAAHAREQVEGRVCGGGEDGGGV